MCGLFTAGKRFLSFVPLELLPDLLDLVGIAAHQELAGRNEHHLRTVHGIGACARMRAAGRGCHGGRGVLYFVLTSRYANHQDEAQPISATILRHSVSLPVHPLLLRGRFAQLTTYSVRAASAKRDLVSCRRAVNLHAFSKSGVLPSVGFEISTGAASVGHNRNLA